MQSCRNALKSLELKSCENASLLMARYLKETKTDEKDDNAIQARNDLFEAMKSAAHKAKEIYKTACERRDIMLKDRGAECKSFETLEPLVIGLGGSNVLETGLTLNPTYGTPMIPGSSLKGITAHYCAEVLGAVNKDYQAGGAIYKALFGSDSEDKEDICAGFIYFYDAWITPETAHKAFINDVMTPHHAKYYSGEEERATDFDDPNPVTFLSLNGTFKVWLACEEPNEIKRSEWLKFVYDLISKALETYGAGGKTRSGYGRMMIKPQEGLIVSQQDNKAAGFNIAVGEVVLVRCTKFEINKKGKEKRTFKFENSADNKAIRFQEPPKVSEGTVFKAKIDRIDRANNVYMLKAL